MRNWIRPAHRSKSAMNLRISRAGWRRIGRLLAALAIPTVSGMGAP